MFFPLYYIYYVYVCIYIFSSLTGGLVLTDVDATCLEYHPQLKDIQFSKIIFNFPHIPGKMNIRKNRQLVEQFFFR